MNKCLSLLILSLLFSAQLSAKENYSWIIVVNTVDCINCIGAVSKIEHLDSRYSKTLVFAKGDKADSALLFKKLFLKDFNGRIVFNDSLYNRFKSASSQQVSSVSLLNNQNNQVITLPLTALAQNIMIMNQFLKTRDTIKMQGKPFNKGTVFKMGTNRIYVLNYSFGTLKVFDRTGRRKSLSPAVDDSLFLKGYKVKYGDSLGRIIAKYSQKYVQLNHLVGKETAIKSLDVHEDTLRLLVSQPLLTSLVPNNKNTISLSHISTLYTYVSDKLIHVENIKNYMNGVPLDATGFRRHVITDKQDPNYVADAYYLRNEFFAYNGKLYLALISPFLTRGKPGSPNQVLAEYKRQNDTLDVFNRYAAHLPQFYIKNAIGYNLNFQINMVHFGPYFTFEFSDTLYSVNKKWPDIPLSFAPKLRVVPKGNDISQGNLAIIDFKINHNILYLLAYLNTDNSYTYIYYKYNLQSKKVLFKKSWTDKDLPQIIDWAFIDPFDYAYVLTPIAENQLVRNKAD